MINISVLTFFDIIFTWDVLRQNLPNLRLHSDCENDKNN